MNPVHYLAAVLLRVQVHPRYVEEGGLIGLVGEVAAGAPAQRGVAH